MAEILHNTQLADQTFELLDLQDTIDAKLARTSIHSREDYVIVRINKTCIKLTIEEAAAVYQLLDKLLSY